MIRLFFVVLIVIQPFILFSQEKIHKDSVFPEATRFAKSVYKIKHNAVDSLKHFMHDHLALESVKDPLHHIKNVGFKFIVRELSADCVSKQHQSDSIYDAVNILLQYVKNDSISNMVFYLKNYIEKQKTEEALKELKKQIEKKTIYKPDLPVNQETKPVDLGKIKQLEKLYNYVKNDSAHQWIREISRDSVLIGVQNFLNDSIKFWINNGKQDYKRFWLKKNKLDSIGIWIQNAPGCSMRILVDDDVYQQSVQYLEAKSKQVKVEGKGQSDRYKLFKLRKYKRFFPAWKVGAIVRLAFNQGYISKNWSGGGESSMATTYTFEGFANYKKRNHIWNNSLKVKYGLLKLGNQKFRTNEDEIDLNTKYGKRAAKNWYYSVQFNLKTQMLKTYSYPNDKPRFLKSNFFAPARIIASVGMDYKPNNHLSILLSPLSAKYTIVSDIVNIDQTVYGIDKDKKIKKEIGSYVSIFYEAIFWEDLEFKNTLTLYSNYSNKPQNIDVDWEVNITMPINRYLSSKISTRLVSDDDTGAKVQFKENFSVGILYRF